MSMNHRDPASQPRAPAIKSSNRVQSPRLFCKLESRRWLRNERKVESDKAWDAMHRTLSDGERTRDGSEYPLNDVVLGGEVLHTGFFHDEPFGEHVVLPPKNCWVRSLARIRPMLLTHQ